MINNSMTEEQLSALREVPVRYFKMMNGDDVVSFVADMPDDNAVIILEEPMVVTIDNDHSYNFSPWFPFSRKNVHLVDSFNIFSEDDVEDDVKATYLKLVLDKIEGVEPSDYELPKATNNGNTTKH